ncbi:3'-5' exonuclease [Chryseosolibacter indicus]|uniref:3'-5' exonuclease n=1 Tax=Chryseosolibacter indicus TaxID=2782351 RepID=A0ABS5VRZ2_9BACT|nr:3'-5' exonuclease [Chryseosolibacter indicus]MBT1703619.1 3'-5' exonuclease [Chryseosolibacter indicus]
MIPELRDILFIDIETVAASRDYNALDERLKVQWARKAGFLRRDGQMSDEDIYHERAGIYAEFGKIICIAVGKFCDMESGELGLRTKVFQNHDEKALLTEFKAMLEKIDSSTLRLCAHNGKEFDFPYICRRMLINSIALPAALNLSGKKGWEVQHLDTMELWKFGDYKHYTSLDLLAAIFNIPSSKTDMDGSQVNVVYYKENDLEKISLYCRRDVVVLAQLFLKLRAYSVIPESNIITV